MWDTGKNRRLETERNRYIPKKGFYSALHRILDKGLQEGEQWVVYL